MNRRKLVGIALAAAIVAAAAGLGFYFLLGTPDGRVPGPLHAELSILSIIGLTVSVSAEGSTGHDGNYKWDFGETVDERVVGGTYSDLVTVSTITTTYTYAAPGIYEIVLTVYEPDTGEFFSYFGREKQFVVVGRPTGFAPSIIIAQTTDGVRWKLLFTEVPESPLLMRAIVLELYDGGGVQLQRVNIRTLFPSQGGDEIYVRARDPIVSVGDYVSLSVDVYPAGTTYKLIEIDLNFVLAEGTLNAKVPDPFLVSVSKSQDGLTWELRFTSVPVIEPASINFEVWRGSRIFGPALLTAMTSGTAVYVPAGISTYIAVGDVINLNVAEFPALSKYFLLNADGSRVLVRGFLDDFASQPIGTIVSRSADGRFWVITITRAPASLLAEAVALKVLGPTGIFFLAPRQITLLSGFYEYVQTAPPDIVAGDTILVLIRIGGNLAPPFGSTFHLLDNETLAVLASGTLA